MQAWKNGRLEDCTLQEFTQQLRRFAGWADNEFGVRSDQAAHLGERLNAAADLIDDMWRRVGAVLEPFPSIKNEASE